MKDKLTKASELLSLIIEVVGEIMLLLMAIMVVGLMVYLFTGLVWGW